MTRPIRRPRKRGRMHRARIGITTSYEDNRQFVDVRYAYAVERAGGVAILVPMFRHAVTARAFASLLDGLVITGGPGITRGLIGELPADLPPVDGLRDTSDKLIYEAMLGRPMLGICYGMQFVNAMAGGSIYADAQHQAAAAAHSPARGAAEHEVRISPGTHLHHIVQAAHLMTNTHHIQAIARLGAGLRIAARAWDGVIEAIESDDGRVMGAQFHPERMEGRAQALFDSLIQQAQSAKAGV